MNYLCILLLSLSVFAKEFEITTNPEGADVFVQAESTKKLVRLGKSPIKVDTNVVQGIVGKQSTYMMKASKEGFEDYKLMMIKTTGSDVKLNLTLSEDKDLKSTKKHDILVSKLFRIQGLIRSNNFTDALERLTSLEKNYSDFSVIPELKGIAYYMKKDMSKALSMFRVAFSKNPANKDAYKMKVYLEKKLGLSLSEKQ